MLFKDRIAVITGAGKGIGKSAALAFAAEGAAVVCIARTLADVERVAKEVEGKGGRALALSCDVSNEAPVKAMISQALELVDL